MRELAYRTSRIFRALGNPLRYRILDRLARGPATPGELAEQLRRPLYVISRHLATLKDNHLVWFCPEPPTYIYSAKYLSTRGFLDSAEQFCEEVRIEDPVVPPGGNRHPAPMRGDDPPPPSATADPPAAEPPDPTAPREESA